MPTQADIEYRLSGGAANTSAAASLGGAMSTASFPDGFIRSNNVSVTTPISGITVLDAPRSNAGAGTLEYTTAGTLATWASFGSAAGNEVNIGTTGRYTLYALDGIQALRISVVAGSLPGSDASTAITVSKNAGGLLDNITATDSINGHTNYRCFYIYNVSASTLSNFRIWLYTVPSGSNIAIGLDPAGTGGSATTIADENTAPSGVTFTTPTNSGDGLFVSSVATTGKFGVWVRRTVTAGSETTGTSSAPISFVLGIAFT